MHIPGNSTILQVRIRGYNLNHFHLVLLSTGTYQCSKANYEIILCPNGKTTGQIPTSSTVHWNGNNWAMSCDFLGNDLSSVKTSSELCGGKCAQTQGCTHFTWTKFNGGTCWMKKGPVSKDKAFSTNDRTMVCGVINDGSGGVKGSTIAWNGNSWAMSCDFRGNDLSNVRSSGEHCGGKCAQTPGCTHFTWTKWNGGTCWMKKGPVSKDKAFPTNDATMVCGLKISA